MVGWIGDPDFVVLLNQARIGKEFRFVQPDLVAHSRHALRLAGKQVEDGSRWQPVGRAGWDRSDIS